MNRSRRLIRRKFGWFLSRSRCRQLRIDAHQAGTALFLHSVRPIRDFMPDSRINGCCRRSVVRRRRRFVVGESTSLLIAIWVSRANLPSSRDSVFVSLSFFPISVDVDCSCAVVEFSDLAAIASADNGADTLMSIDRRIFCRLVSSRANSSRFNYTDRFLPA